MDKNNKNRTDLLAAGRKRLQQFRKKKDGKGNKSSAKPSNSGSDADADKSELISPHLSREGSSVNDSSIPSSVNDSSIPSSVNDSSIPSSVNDPSIPSSEDNTQTTSIDDPVSTPVVPEKDLVTTSVADSIELLPEEQVSLKSSAGNEQVSESLKPQQVDSINVVEGSSNNESGNLEPVVSDGDPAHSAILNLEDSSNLKPALDTTRSVSISDDVRVDGADQGGDCLPPEKIVKDNEIELKDNPMLGLPGSGESVETATGIKEPKMENLGASPTINIVDVPASAGATDEGKEGLQLEGTLVSAQPFESSAVQEDISIPGSSATDASSQSLIPDSHVIERLKEQLYLSVCEKDIFLFQLDEQSKLELDFDQERQQLYIENEKLRIPWVECQESLQSLQAENTNLNDSLVLASEERRNLEQAKDSLKSLQVENASLNDSLVLALDERRNLEEARKNIAGENDKLLTELAECRACLDVLRVENDKLNENLFSAMEDRKELAEQKTQFSVESEKLSLELADCKNLLADLQLEYSKSLDELNEAKSRLEQPSEDNNRLLLPTDGVSSAQLKDHEQSFGPLNFKGQLDKTEKIMQVLDQKIEEIQSHSILLGTQSRKMVAPVSKLIQAFESKSHQDDSDDVEVSSSENTLLTESILLAKEQTSSLRALFKELLRDTKNFNGFSEAQEDGNFAEASLGELTVSYDALKEHTDSCETTSIENVVLYEFFKQHSIDIEGQRVELLSQYDTTRQHNIRLDAENCELVSKIDVAQSRIMELERKIDKMLLSSDESVSSFSKKVDALCKEVAESDLRHEQVIQSLRQFCAFVSSTSSTHETPHDDALDLVGFVAVSIDAATSFIENLQENLEACKIDHEIMNSSCMEMVEKCNDLGRKNELAIGILHHLRSKLKKLVTTSSGLGEKSQIIEENENLVDPLHVYNYDTLIEQINMLLNGGLQLESENNRLRSELIDRDNHVEELKIRSLDSDAILQLVENVESTISQEGVRFNSDKFELRLHDIISFLFQNYIEAVEQLSLSRETSTSHEMELSLLEGKMDNLSFVAAQHENEIVILKESLRDGREAFDTLQAELQSKVNELEHSEQRASSIREKLSIAVSKGKGLIVQRDNLKQSLAETSGELEKYAQELQLKESMLEEVETKLKTYSEAGRVEALESELSYIRNSATALRESFLLKDSVLQRIEEILEDLELPENFHSRDIIEKVDWLARSVTGTALPLADWDQKSSGEGGSYTDDGFVATDAWKEDVQQNHSSDDDMKKKYEELQSKFYGLAEQNDMLEQSLMERNNVVQRWEEIIDRVDMPLELRSVEPEDRIEWLANAISEAHQHSSSLQQKVDHLETYCTSLNADLDQSQMRFADLNTSLQAVTNEKEELLKNLEISASKYNKTSQIVAKLESDNDKLQNEITVLQEKLAVEVKNYEVVNANLQNEVIALQEKLAEKVERYGLIEGEITRLEELISGVIEDSVTGDVFTSSVGTDRLENLLRKLVEQYTTLCLKKSVISESEQGQITRAIDEEKKEREDKDENEATASQKDLQDALHALTCVKEERDKYIEINQSLSREVEAIELERQELQEQLSLEEQKLASVREKLNVAVRKGKSLVQHRDSLKQAMEEMNKEVERLKSEIKSQEISQFDYEQKMKDLSTNKERVEVLESETLGLKNLLADTQHFLQEKTHALNLIVDTLDGFDAGFNISDPVEKLKQIARRWHDLQVALTSSENNFNKAKRSSELLLAELNEVQERNDVLQEELAEAHNKLSELSRERDFSEASKDEAISQLENLSSLHYYERNKQVTELIAIKSSLTELSESYYSIIDIVGSVLSKEVEHLGNLETSMKSCLEASSAHVGGLSLGDPHSIFPINSDNRDKFFLPNSLLESEMQESIENNRFADVCSLLGSRLQAFLKEIGVVKGEIYKYSLTLDERAKHLAEVAGIVCMEVISQKQSLKSVTERDEENVALRKSISLLFEACSSSVMEIENWKSQFMGTNLIVEDMQKLFDSSTDSFSSEQCSRSVADRLLFVVRDFIRSQTEIIEGDQREMKVTITNLQKELQEKDIQKERTCVELVTQIREAEAAARSHLEDSQSVKAQLDHVNRHLEVMEEEHNMLKQRIKELEDSESTLKELDERARSLTSVLVAKDQEIEALMQALDEEETQMEDLTNKVSELERVVQQNNSDLENLQASRAKVMKKLSITVSKFDELHHLSASLLSEVEKLQSQVHERDEEISFLRQEVTRCTNDALLASQMSNKRNSNGMHDLVTWLKSLNLEVQEDVEGIDDLSRDQGYDYKGLLQKQIGALLCQLEDLRVVVQSQDALLQVEKTKVEDLTRKGEFLENSLREKDSQLSRDSGWMGSSTSEIVEVEPTMNKWSVTPQTPQVRTLRKGNSDQVAIAIDTNNSGTGENIEDEDDDKAHGFKSLTTSRVVPRFTRPLTDLIDGLWVTCDRTLMRKPALRLCVIIYWAVMHTLLANFVV